MQTATPLFVALVLTACNSNGSVLDPSSGPQPSVAVGVQSMAAAQEIPPATAPEPAGDFPTALASPGLVAPAGTLNAQAAALSPNARVQLAPIIGSTVEALTPLMRRLSQRAAQHRIALASSVGPDTTHVIKGYFSTVADGGETTVIYVWDVFDPTGSTRLHRIQGLEKTEKTAAQGWAGVSNQTMETIGDSTIDQFAAWLARRPV